jgi:hypothetical protein
LPAQKKAILKIKSLDELMAYAQEQNIKMEQEQANMLIAKIKQFNNDELSEEEKDYASASILSEPPCRYCGSGQMELSVDSFGIYLTCFSCKCNIIEI